MVRTVLDHDRDSDAGAAVGILTIDLLQRATGRVYWERH
jgi:hypothetical protein